ncbi:MAG: NAD(P)-dependent oxidoreductase [Bacteroidales bacterium]|nr:NAD(P)-dependent oxidoreductase [Bacteroidales bacterium]
MKIFLTGGTGFIGSYVTKILSDEGYSITLLARNPDKVPALHSLPGVTLVEGQINDYELIRKLMPGHEVCIHIALHWGDSPVQMLLNDTRSSVNLFETAAEAGVKEIIYTSSTAANDSVYMDPEAVKFYPDLTVHEHSKQRPFTYYGATKGATELFLNAIAYQYKLKANTIRPGYTFGNPVIEGSDMEMDSRFRDLACTIKRNEPLQLVKNDGTQFIWAGDLAKVYKAVLQHAVNERTYFGLGKCFYSWEDVARETIRRTGSKTELTLIDKGWSDTPSLFDVSAIEEDFSLSFDPWERLLEHCLYLAARV